MRKLVLILGLSFILSFSANASEYIPCGESEAGSCFSCGDTCSARLTYSNETDAINQTNATLTFSGNGHMYNYESPNDNPEFVEPWYGVRDSIKNVVVEEGITHLGNRTVYWMENLTDVSLPQSLTSIGMRAFFGSKRLKEINIPPSVTSIREFAFQRTKVKEIVIPENLTNFSNAFICEGNIKKCSNVAPIEKIYCTSNNADACAEAVAHLGITPTIYEKTQNGDYYVNGKWYQNLNDILSGNNIKKRIYTIDEANRVAGTKNRVSIKYR